MKLFTKQLAISSDDAATLLANCLADHRFDQPAEGTIRAIVQGPSQLNADHWDAIVIEAVADATVRSDCIPAMLLYVHVWITAAARTGLRTEGSKRRRDIAMATQLAIDRLTSRRWVRTSRDGYSVGSRAPRRFHAPPEARVVSDTGWRHTSSSKPMQGWTELERRIEFGSEASPESMARTLIRLDHEHSPMIATSPGRDTTTTQLDERTWMLNFTEDHTSIY